MGYSDPISKTYSRVGYHSCSAGLVGSDLDRYHPRQSRSVLPLGISALPGVKILNRAGCCNPDRGSTHNIQLRIRVRIYLSIYRIPLLSRYVIDFKLINSLDSAIHDVPGPRQYETKTTETTGNLRLSSETTGSCIPTIRTRMDHGRLRPCDSSWQYGAVYHRASRLLPQAYSRLLHRASSQQQAPTSDQTSGGHCSQLPRSPSPTRRRSISQGYHTPPQSVRRSVSADDTRTASPGASVSAGSPGAPVHLRRDLKVLLSQKAKLWS